MTPNQAGGVSCTSREDSYVDLSVISGEKVDLEWLNSDREAIMNLKYLKQESISLDKLWEPTDQVVMVRGVAGIGKSTMINRYVLKWAKEEILTGSRSKEKIDFLFFLECRELNTKPDLNSLEKLLKETYPKVFEYLNLCDLEKIADRVMIVVDGLDELQGIYQEADETWSITELIKNLISTKSGLLKGHKTIACGRPKACEFIKSTMQSQKTKLVEVCGFNEKKTTEYIDRFFKDDLERAEKVKELIKRTNLRIMSSVPVLLWVICLLYSEDFDDEINSTTELYTYGLFTFLKHHLRGNKNLEDQNLRTLVSMQEFGEIVYSLSKLSVKTYMNNEMIFTDDDIKDIHCPIHFEQTGLIVKHFTGKFGCEAYQFRHLVFQEYLCALNLCLAKGVSQYSTNRELSSCTPTILGIHHLISEGRSQLFAPFYQSLKIIHKASRSNLNFIKAPYDRFRYERFIEKHLIIAKMIEQLITKDEGGRLKFVCYTSDFKLEELMKNVREMGGFIDKDSLQKITSCYLDVQIFSSEQSLEILEFLKSLKVQSIDHLFLVLHNDETFKKPGFDLISMAKKNSTLEIKFICDNFWYISNSNWTALYIPTINLLVSNVSSIIPTEITNFHTFYVIKLYHIASNTDELFDKISRMIFDLIEVVLENEEKEGLMIIGHFDEHQVRYERLVRKIKDEFQHREHFDKIKFEIT